MINKYLKKNIKLFTGKCFETDLLTEERAVQVCYLTLKSVIYVQTIIV